MFQTTFIQIFSKNDLKKKGKSRRQPIANDRFEWEIVNLYRRYTNGSFLGRMKYIEWRIKTDSHSKNVKLTAGAFTCSYRLCQLMSLEILLGHVTKVTWLDDPSVDGWEGVSATVSVELGVGWCDVHCFGNPSLKPSGFSHEHPYVIIRKWMWQCCHVFTYRRWTPLMFLYLFF